MNTIELQVCCHRVAWQERELTIPKNQTRWSGQQHERERQSDRQKERKMVKMIEEDIEVKWNSSLQNRQMSAVTRTWKRQQEKQVWQSKTRMCNTTMLPEKNSATKHLFTLLLCCPHPFHAQSLFWPYLSHIMLHITFKFRTVSVTCLFFTGNEP